MAHTTQTTDDAMTDIVRVHKLEMPNRQLFRKTETLPFCCTAAFLFCWAPDEWRSAGTIFRLSVPSELPQQERTFPMLFNYLYVLIKACGRAEIFVYYLKHWSTSSFLWLSRQCEAELEQRTTQTTPWVVNSEYQLPRKSIHSHCTLTYSFSSHKLGGTTGTK